MNTQGTTERGIAPKMAAAAKLEARMRNQRFRFRNVLGEKIRMQSNVPASMPSLTGTDSRGNSLRFRKINLKVEFLDNGLILMKTGVDGGWAGKQIVGGVPEKKSTLDIYNATRRAIRIQEGLQAGRVWRDVALEEIEKMNSRLYELGEWGSPLWIYSYRLVINSLSNALKDTINPLKQEAKDMLGEAAEFLGKASIETDVFEKKEWISLACSKLTSFRIILGEWRDKQVEGMIAYNKMRECFLRTERDWKVWKALKRLVAVYSGKNRWAIFGRDQKDLRYSRELEGIAASKRKRKGKIEMLDEVGERMEKGKYTWGGKGFNLQLIDQAKECYENGKNEKGRKLLRRGTLILEIDKPAFIAEQLGQAEGYMQPVAEAVGEGANHIKTLLEAPRKGPRRKEELNDAVECFRKALREMEAIER